MQSNRSLAAIVCAAALSLGACSAFWKSPEVRIPKTTPPQWYTPSLPHHGSPENLQNWWARLQEPILIQWIAAAQKLSSDVASARAQVFAARASLAASHEALLPAANAIVSAQREFSGVQNTTANSAFAGLQSSWELGFWGQNAEKVRAAKAKFKISNAHWHEAMVLIAVEVARLFYAQRMCLQQLHIRLQDQDSRKKTLQNTTLLAHTGFRALSDARLAQASVAEGQRLHIEQQATCDTQVKALVALTGIAEPLLRNQIEQMQQQRNPTLQNLLSVPAVPAQAIAQRPDVYRAQWHWVSASVEVGLARAALLPSLRFNGTILVNRVGNNFETWSLGPLQITLPIFSRRSLNAREKSAYAFFEAAGKSYSAVVRQAVREVEVALVALNKVNALHSSTQSAASNYSSVLQAQQALYRAGLVSLLQVEETRRLKLQAENVLTQAYYERMLAWIALYQALGGGFDIIKNNGETMHAN